MKATFIFLTWFLSLILNTIMSLLIIIFKSYNEGANGLSIKETLMNFVIVVFALIIMGILSLPYLLVLSIATHKLTRKSDESSIRFQMMMLICLFAVVLIYWLILAAFGSKMHDMKSLLPFFAGSCISVSAALLLYRKRFLKIKPNKYESNMV